MDAGFLNVVEIGQYVMTKTLHNFYNFMQWPVVNTLFQEKEHHNQKDASKGIQRLGPYRKLQPVACMVSMELRSESCP